MDFDLAGWVKEHSAKLTLGGMGGVGGMAFLAKDSLKEWWADRHAEKKAELEERRVHSGFGDKLANDLLAILREDLRGNAALLKELTVTMGEFRDIMRSQKDQLAEVVMLAKKTHDSQVWLERRYGGGPNAHE